MKWKPDSIEQFVRYKIEHPEESFMTLRNYEAEKKHNEHIDKLYKELSKYRSQLNHFKSELFKLNQVTGQQLEANEQQVNSVNVKIHSLGDKLSKAKSLSGVTSKERKRLLVEEYEEEINRFEAQRYQEEAVALGAVQELSRIIYEEIGQSKREVMVETIRQAKIRIQKRLQERQLRKEKKDRVRELSHRHTVLQQKVSLIKSQLTEMKFTRQKVLQEQQDAKNKQILDTTRRLQKFKNEFLDIISPKVVCSQTPLQELLQADVNSNSSMSRDRKWNNWKEQFSDNIQTIREYMMRVEYYIGNNFGVSGGGPSKEQEIMMDQIEQSRSYLSQFDLFAQIAALDESLTFKQHLMLITDKIQNISLQSRQYFQNEEAQFKLRQVQIDTKDKQIDKQITQLQAKVNKTDLQINKFLKNKY